MIKQTLSLIAIMVVVGCAKKTNPATSDNCEWNNNRTGKLCVKNTIDPKSGLETITYTIYSDQNQVVKKGTLSGGFVRWLNDEAIEIYQPPGMMREGTEINDLIKVFLVERNEMVSKSDYQSK